jgi:L-alanine-DL-glutamate epimerase-like enolase superfamily enzyme
MDPETIVAVDSHPVAVRRRRPTLSATLDHQAHLGGPVAVSYFVVIRLETSDGAFGYGEISDAPLHQWPGLAEIRGFLERRLLGSDASRLEVLTRPERPALDRRLDETAFDLLSAGIDSALYDLRGRRLGVPAHDLVGGLVNQSIPLSWVIYIDTLEALEAEVAQRMAEGFEHFKLKVGIDPDLDVERVRLVREAAGDRAIVKLDANSAWSVEEAVTVLRRMERWHPDGVETPIPYRDVAGKAEVRRRTGVPILEHVNDVPFAVELLRHEAVDVMNVATVGAGGIWRARRILGLAEGAGIACLLGSTLELGIGTAAQLHLAAGSPALTWPSDLVGPQVYERDVIREKIEPVEGSLRVPTGPGLGVEVDPVALRELRTDALEAVGADS